MKRIYIANYIFVLAAILSDPVFAINLEVSEPSFLLPIPPQDNSSIAIAERAFIKKLIDNASSLDLQSAQADAMNETVAIFESSIDGFIVSGLPETYNLFEKIRSEEKRIASKYKIYFNKTRPYEADPSIKLCLSPTSSKTSLSYPSGHAVMAFAFAIVLINLLPDYSVPIMSRAENYSQNRIICGFHYPFDVRSGQVLGTVIGLEVLRSSYFKPYLDAARKELYANGF